MAFKFDSEVWGLKTRDEQRQQTSQLKFLRRLLGIAKLDGERNQSVSEKLLVHSALLEMQEHQREWVQHVEGMDTNGIAERALKYKTKQKR